MYKSYHCNCISYFSVFRWHFAKTQQTSAKCYLQHHHSRVYTVEGLPLLVSPPSRLYAGGSSGASQKLGVSVDKRSVLLYYHFHFYFFCKLWLFSFCSINIKMYLIHKVSYHINNTKRQESTDPQCDINCGTFQVCCYYLQIKRLLSWSIYLIILLFNWNFLTESRFVKIIIEFTFILQNLLSIFFKMLQIFQIPRVNISSIKNVSIHFEHGLGSRFFLVLNTSDLTI